MRVVSIFLIGLIVFSCKKPETQKAVFDSIDFTYSNGGTKITSVNLDSNKVLNVRVSELNKGIRYYRALLTDSLFYKIDSIAFVLFKEKPDSVFNQPMLDCSSYDFVMTMDGKQFTFHLYCMDNFRNRMDALVYPLLRASENIKTETKDSTFVFKSYERMAPPIIDSNVVFIPPVIKDDETVK